MSYDAKNEQVRSRQLKTQKLSLPFSVVGHATPGSKTIVVDDPSILFLQFEGKDGMTVALGAFDTAGELSALTLTTADDSDGKFNAVIRIGEALSKVLSAKAVLRGSATQTGIDGEYVTGASAGITSGGDKIVLYFNTTAAFEVAATTQWVIEVEYVVSE